MEPPHREENEKKKHKVQENQTKLKPKQGEGKRKETNKNRYIKTKNQSDVLGDETLTPETTEEEIQQVQGKRVGVVRTQQDVFKGRGRRNQRSDEGQGGEAERRPGKNESRQIQQIPNKPIKCKISRYHGEHYLYKMEECLQEHTKYHHTAGRMEAAYTKDKQYRMEYRKKDHRCWNKTKNK